jgi:DHA1 family bicyclomycin/chloramphenicol resistance-like MFS transporter
MSNSQHPYLLPLVTVLTMLGPFSVDTYLPAFPAMESDYGISTAHMSQTLGAFLFAFAFSTLAWGPLMDRFGRKHVVLVSLLGFALVSTGCALSTEYNAFLGFRIAQGLFASCGVIGGRAMVRDVYEGQSAVKAMSRVMFFFALGPAIAPVVGAVLLDAWGWQSIFWFQTILGFILALGLMFLVKETQHIDHVQPIHPLAVLANYTHALRNPYFVLLLLAMACAFSGLFIYIAGASRVVYDFLHLGAEEFWILFVPMVAGLMIGSWLSGKMSATYTPQAAVVWGFIIMTLAVMMNVTQVAFLPANPVTVIMPMTVYALGFSILLPNIGIMLLDCYPKNRGMASALQGFAHMGGNAMVASVLIPLILGKLLWFVLAQLVLLTVAFLWWRLALILGKPCA